MDEWQKYFIPSTISENGDKGTLKNFFNITDKQELEEKEKLITLEKLSELILKPVEGDFDSEHLRKIHEVLFEEIYPFAGEYRTCTLAKKNTTFYDPEIIEDSLKNVLANLNHDVVNIKDKNEYAKLLSEAYFKLVQIHPFREGNGRTIREFLREFVHKKNELLPFEVELDYRNMDKNQVLIALKLRVAFPNLLEYEFLKCLVPVKKIDDFKI